MTLKKMALQKYQELQAKTKELLRLQIESTNRTCVEAFKNRFGVEPEKVLSDKDEPTEIKLVLCDKLTFEARAAYHTFDFHLVGKHVMSWPLRGLEDLGEALTTAEKWDKPVGGSLFRPRFSAKKNERSGEMVKEIIFYDNGNVAVLDEHGQQVPAWQLNYVKMFLQALAQQGARLDGVKVLLPNHRSYFVWVDETGDITLKW